MTSDKDRKRYLKLFARDQDYKDRLLKLQSQKLIDDLKNADEVKKIQTILTTNQRKLEKLAKHNHNNIHNSNELITELSYQLTDMQNQLTVHKRKLVAYREAAKKFKRDLDNAEDRKKDFLEEVGMYEEYVSIQSAVKLTSDHKASEKVNREFAMLTDKQKVKRQRFSEKMESVTITVEPTSSITAEPNTITLFSEHEDFDDLSLIKGVGPKFQILLNNEGINTFEQIANWTEEDVKKRDKRIVFRGRVEREKWVEQAKKLVAKKN